MSSMEKYNGSKALPSVWLAVEELVLDLLVRLFGEEERLLSSSDVLGKRKGVWAVGGCPKDVR